MDDELNQLKSEWKAATSATEQVKLQAEDLIVKAKKSKKQVLQAHYGNMLVLMLTLIMISAFFYYMTAFQEIISKIGVVFMVGGLAVRILIEWISVIKSRQIDLTQQAANSVDSSIRFYQFRKKIHGPVTVSIVGLYTLGFYMLTPEFSRYIELHWMIIMDVGYVVGAIILITQIRKGIKKEMDDLAEILDMKREIATLE